MTPVTPSVAFTWPRSQVFQTEAPPKALRLAESVSRLLPRFLEFRPADTAGTALPVRDVTLPNSI